MISLFQILVQSADKALERQNKNGSMPSGHNGPYFDPETPVRNTCHWLITFLKVFEITKVSKYLEAANKCIDYIVGQKTLYNYCHRTKEGKDKCNGLIGPAWVMEALLISSKKLNRKDLSDIAAEIFLIHKYDTNLNLWHRIEIDGSILSIDWTFNHQLWFASIASMFCKENYPEIHKTVSIFTEKINSHLEIYQNGLICHALENKLNLAKRIRHLVSAIKKIFVKNEVEISKAIAYHQFNLYALAILKENCPELSIFKSNKFARSLKFIESKEYENGLKNNKFGFGYNVAGIEVAYILECFINDSRDKQKYWLEKQFRTNYNFEKKSLCMKTEDPETLSARLYEATRVSDIKLFLEF